MLFSPQERQIWLSVYAKTQFILKRIQTYKENCNSAACGADKTYISNKNSILNQHFAHRMPRLFSSC